MHWRTPLHIILIRTIDVYTGGLLCILLCPRLTVYAQEDSVVPFFIHSNRHTLWVSLVYLHSSTTNGVCCRVLQCIFVCCGQTVYALGSSSAFQFVADEQYVFWDSLVHLFSSIINYVRHIVPRSYQVYIPSSTT